ncbi:MAG: protein translocase subunit SecD, partial [Sphingomonadales bacterium]
MLDFPTWKKVWLWGLTLVAALAALPSIFAAANMPWPETLPDPEVNLGLDLAGGSHILLEADASQVRGQRLENMEESVRAIMRNAQPRIRIGDVSTSGGQLSFIIDDPADLDRARELMLPQINGTGLVREWDLS